MLHFIQKLLFLRFVTLRKATNALLCLLAYHLNAKKLVAKTLPVFLSIETSARCNLRCPECAIGTHSFTRNAQFDVERFKQLVDQVAKHTISLMLYFQGEPLLHPHLPAMCSYAHKHGLHTTISTNAQLLTPQLCQELVASGLQHIIISVDGVTQSSYERYRVGGLLQKAIDAIGYLQEEKKRQRKLFPIVEVQFIVFRHNEQEIDAIRHLSKQWGADHLSIKTAQIYNYQEKEALIPTIKKYSRYVQRNGCWQLRKPLRNRCRRCYLGAVINSEAQMLPCCFDKLSQHPWGNVCEQNIASIWHSDAATDFRNAIRRNRKSIAICTNCTE